VFAEIRGMLVGSVGHAAPSGQGVAMVSVSLWAMRESQGLPISL
jgi:hypothetical protein